jgi:hypothetical protein
MALFGLFASRKEIAEKKKQIREAEKKIEAERKKQIRIAEKQEKAEKKKQLREEQKRMNAAAKPAERLIKSANNAIRKAEYSVEGKAKLASLNIAKQKISELKTYASQYQFIKLYNIENAVAKIEELYSDALLKYDRQNDKSYKNNKLNLKKLIEKAKSCNLVKQCQLFNLPLDIMEFDNFNKPEQAVYNRFTLNGYYGAYCEGGVILTALKALCLDKLEEFNTNPFSKRNDACNRFFEAQCLINNSKSELLLDAMANTSKTKFIDNFKEIYSDHNRVSSYYPGLTVDFMSKLYDGVDKNTFINIARLFMEDPYLYRSGWPDITLIRGNELRFIEVKTTSDRLSESQINTIQTMREVLPDSFSVIKALKMKYPTKR